MSELNKQEAIAYLGISERTLERYTKRHKIAVRYENTEHGRQPFYPIAELDRVKEERSSTYHPAITTEETGITFTPQERSLLQVWVENTLVAQRLDYRLVLNLNEAAAISGLSKSHLLQAIKGQQLNAQKIGRGWKVRKRDLEDYIDSLFSH